MNRLMWLVWWLAIPMFAFAADPPANTAYRAIDDKLLVFGTDNDFRLVYNSTQNRLELRDNDGIDMFVVTDLGNNASLGIGRVDLYNSAAPTFSSRVTSGATANRTVVLPDASGEISLLGQTIEGSEITDGTIAAVDIATGAVTSDKILDGTIAAADIASNSVTSAKILDGEIVNADINANAGIAITKLSSSGASAGYVLTYNGSAITWAAGAAGSIGGTGPLKDNAIPRMNGTGGVTLQGYLDDNNAPTVDDTGLMTLRNGLHVTNGSDQPYTLFESLSEGIQVLNSPIFWYRGGTGFGSVYTRHSLTVDTSSESGSLGGNSLQFRAYDNSGNYSHAVMTLHNDPSAGVVISGLLGTPRNLYVDGNIYAGTGGTQITSSGKVLLSALAQTSATTGQFLAWNGSAWAPQTGSTDWGSPGAIGSVAPNSGQFTSITASTPIADASISDTLTIGAGSTVANGALDTELRALAGLTSAADKLPYWTGSGTAANADFTSFGRSLVDDADAATARTTLGLGTMATQNANNVAITGGTGTFTGGVLKNIKSGTGISLLGSTALSVQNSSSSASDCFLSIISGNAGSSRLFFGDTDSESAGQIWYTHGTGMNFLVEGNSQLNLTTSAATISQPLTVSTHLTVNGNTTLGDAAADTVHFNSNSIDFEGSTADNFETAFSFTNPTADRTVTFPDRDGITATTTSEIGFDPGRFWTAAIGFYSAGVAAEQPASGYVVNGLRCIDGSKICYLCNDRTPTDMANANVTVTIDWVTTSSSTNSVVWGTAYECTPAGTDVSTTVGWTDPDVGHKTSANAGAGLVNSVSFTPATPAHYSAGSPFMLFVGRVGDDAADTLAATAWIVGVKVTYTRL